MAGGAGAEAGAQVTAGGGRAYEQGIARRASSGDTRGWSGTCLGHVEKPVGHSSWRRARRPGHQPVVAPAAALGGPLRATGGHPRGAPGAGAASTAPAPVRHPRRERPIPEGLTWAVMALDVVLLTVLLELSGGASNPFSALYLVHIALAAVVLREGWTWALTVLAVACFGELFVGAPAHHHIHDMRMHLEGMWAAFALAAGFIVYFVQRVTRALAAREAELVSARAASARHDKLAALATLAAGAAHELSTPLSTIAVVARELERHLERAGQETSSLEDVRLIREQVARCRDILARMASDAGASQGEALG